MRYKVRIYCVESWQFDTCQHVPPHPYILPEVFATIRQANDHGGAIVAQINDDQVEWEVLDETGKAVC